MEHGFNTDLRRGRESVFNPCLIRGSIFVTSFVLGELCAGTQKRRVVLNEIHAAFGFWRRLERLEKAGGRDAFWFLFGPM